MPSSLRFRRFCFLRFRAGAIRRRRTISHPRRLESFPAKGSAGWESRRKAGEKGFSHEPSEPRLPPYQGGQRGVRPRRINPARRFKPFSPFKPLNSSTPDPFPSPCEGEGRGEGDAPSVPVDDLLSLCPEGDSRRAVVPSSLRFQRFCISAFPFVPRTLRTLPTLQPSNPDPKPRNPNPKRQRAGCHAHARVSMAQGKKHGHVRRRRMDHAARPSVGFCDSPS